MGIILTPVLSLTFLQDLQHNNSGISSISHNLDRFNSISECSIRVYLLSTVCWHQGYQTFKEGKA